MPGERQNAKIVNFGQVWSRPFGQHIPEAAVHRLHELSDDFHAHIQDIRNVFENPTPGGKALQYETSHRIRFKIPRPVYPTAWEHLLRDDGLG